MKIILFGATGMIGQGVLRECLADPDVERVLTVGRGPAGSSHPKVGHLQVADFLDYSAVEDRLQGYDACLFCLGVSSEGLDEAAYRRVTYDITLAAATTLARLAPAMAFLYISGRSTDATGAGKVMWARVKGQTENALLALPFRAVHMLRPGFIQPLDGIRSRTPLYRAIYAVAALLMPVLRRVMPEQLLDTRELGRAMIRVAREGYPAPRLEVQDIRSILA